MEADSLKLRIRQLIAARICDDKEVDPQHNHEENWIQLASFIWEALSQLILDSETTKLGLTPNSVHRMVWRRLGKRLELRTKVDHQVRHRVIAALRKALPNLHPGDKLPTDTAEADLDILRCFATELIRNPTNISEKRYNLLALQELARLGIAEPNEPEEFMTSDEESEPSQIQSED